ncbi:uncharacterized protein ACLA_020550 [Aspergillus clavatus NRRL 1]|uniref:Uncharacterized protein n=1 Tax=Aspergillus clavatus (strain ATCC 1007 / CBS 513.65 / DSM 816 / NCTC 3887 / NRRL 1 / QM 1276 / 107) TaxID=344612 RepID=A1CNX7_ASPCL|nr:uncharacterized protein ACLA_020550 [Aspergillus clavatus NRRL 1]EAW07348.1 hypothetical protein ACLA_020550 [Aspergillus clavatus NRRL 1]
MQFELSDHQQRVKESARAFAQAVLNGASETYSHLPTQSERFESIRPIYSKAVAAGQVKALIPAPTWRDNYGRRTAPVGTEGGLISNAWCAGTAPADSEPKPAQLNAAVVVLLVTREDIVRNNPAAYTVLEEQDLIGHPAVSGPHTKFVDFRLPGG